jgi:hypothetical protein
MTLEVAREALEDALCQVRKGLFVELSCEVY